MIVRVLVLAVLTAIVTAFSEEEIEAENSVLKQQSSVADTNSENDIDLLLDGAGSHWSRHSRHDDAPMKNVTDACKSIMHHFAHAGGNFTKCSLDHARPFRMCEKCVTAYTRFMRMYEELQDDKHCSELLLLADRVQVVTSTYKSFKTTWADAYCDKCYDSVDVNATTGKVSFNFTADMLMLYGMQANVSQCFLNNANIIPLNETETNSSAVCTVCREIYQEMNNKYLELKDKNGGHMCMDLVDMMNYTRLMWSSKFRCSRPMPSPVSVIIICVVAALAVFVFYISRPYTANIRKPHIFKAKRMGTAHSRYGTLTEEIADRSLPQMATSPTGSVEARRRVDSQQPVDGNSVPRTTAQTS